MHRNLNKEAWCWYHRTSEVFFNGAVDACQAVLDFFKAEALSRGLADYGRNNQIYDSWQKHVRELKLGIELARHGDYAPLEEACSSVNSTNRGVNQHVWMGWLGEAEGEYRRRAAIAGDYASQIQEVLRPGLNGGGYWLEEAADDTPESRNWDFGPTGESVAFFLKGVAEDDYPHLRQHPAPTVYPGYTPDPSRPVKTGECVPWTGVWIPAVGLDRHSLTFAIEGLPMPPSWRIVKTEEEVDAELRGKPGYTLNKSGRLIYDPDGNLAIPERQLEITEMLWYPLLPVADEPAANKRGRVEANVPCPITGYWSTPAKQDSRKLFKQGETMPDFPGSSYGATIWYWDQHQD
ncbi:hypothetical protein ACTSKR_08155 [Chitinibacteraceae bacterium HSL-7]